MKTVLKVAGLALAAAAIIAGGIALGATVARAQAQAPAASANPIGPGGIGPGDGRGPGRMGRGMMGGGGLLAGYRDQMDAAIAKGLGMSIEDFNAAIASGKTAWQIAQEKGLSAEQFQAVMVQALSEVLAQAVKDGKLTQAQADTLLERMKQGAAPGFGPHHPGFPYLGAS